MTKILVSIAITGLFVTGLMLGQGFAQLGGEKVSAARCDNKPARGYCTGSNAGQGYGYGYGRTK